MFKTMLLLAAISPDFNIVLQEEGAQSHSHPLRRRGQVRMARYMVFQDQVQVHGLPGSGSSRYRVSQVQGLPGIWSPRYMVFQVHGLPGIWSSRYMVFQVQGLLGSGSSRYMVFHVQGFSRYRVARYRVFQVQDFLTTPHSRSVIKPLPNTHKQCGGKALGWERCCEQGSNLNS